MASLTAPLAAMGAVFVLLQVVAPVHQAVGENLGNRVSAWLYDDLTDSVVAPPGIGHLEDPELIGDITVARDFDAGVSGPPMEVNLPFIATGLVDLGAGLASAIVLLGYSWWAVMQGKVTFFDADRGFGFISFEGREDVFVHVSNLQPARRRSPRVRPIEFEVGPRSQGARTPRTFPRRERAKVEDAAAAEAGGWFRVRTRPRPSIAGSVGDGRVG